MAEEKVLSGIHGGTSIRMIIQGSVETKTVNPKVLGSIDPQRATVMFRY